MPKLYSLTNKNIDQDGDIDPSSVPDWDKVTELQISSKTNLKKLNPEKLPRSLNSLIVGGCPNLSSIRNLPENIEKLVLINLKIVDLDLASLKKNLKLLNLKGSNNIDWSEDLSIQIQDLKNNNCIIDYPKDEELLQNGRSRIKSLKDSYPNLHNLLDVYFEKSLDKGGVKADLAKNVISLIDIFDQVPEKQSWLEGIAKEFINDESDVNKKFAGLFQVFSWLEIARQENGEQKLEALIPLMIYDFAIKFVNEKLSENGNSDSFDQQLLVNAAVGRIHQEFKECGDIVLDWAFVPKTLFPKHISSSVGVDENELRIQFGEILRNPIQEKIDVFFTKENSEHLERGARQILKEMTNENVDDFFLGKKEIFKLWCQAAFPDQYREFKNQEITKSTSVTLGEGSWFDNVKIFGDRIIELTKNLIPKTSASSPKSNSLETKFLKIEMSGQ
ncbi:MAG: hypothetical protein ACJAZX_001166 [Rickettsiales bacterium]|jgi:hypothetical protein